MGDVEKLLTEVREALKDSKCWCGQLIDRDDCSRCAALAAFPAEMPGAIGELVNYAACDPGKSQYVRDQLANLEVK